MRSNLIFRAGVNRARRAELVNNKGVWVADTGRR
jgi:hypothetical protein